jgi:glycosyltransferase involved in cell wall biosynthesis
MTRAIDDWLATHEPDVLVCDFVTPSLNVPVEPGCPTVLFQHNVEALIWKRHAEVQTDPLRRTYLREQWRRAVRYERAACRRYDQVIAVSREDARIMREEYGIETVADVPTGVDTDFFSPSGAAHRDPHGLVFTGSMDWRPNQDAVFFFAEQILPRVRKIVPDVTLTVVGRNPSADLLVLGQRDPAIRVTGRVDDVRPYMDAASGYVIPLRIGGGTRLKVYEAMAMEMPMVSTRIGAEGLPVDDGEHLLLADEPKTFADAVIRVLTEPTMAREMGLRAAELVRTDFGWESVARRFEELCLRAAERHQGAAVAAPQLA